jgi:outer membrane protein assembly factor BamB
MWAGLCLLPAAARAGIPSWTTYHRDGARSGVDPDSTAPVTPTQVWQTNPSLDGNVYAEPLVYGSTVYVATENDTVYALNAATGAIVWQRHLGTPVSDSVIPGTGDINPIGITSTPVIDPTTGRIFVVADTWDGSNAASVVHEMFALNLADGSVAVGPVPVDPPGSTHTDQLQRTSLALDGGKVIIGYGGNDGDQGNYHGWEVAVPEGGGPLQSFEVDSQPGDSQGAIWAAGNAPAIDSSGDIWVATGNGTSTNFDFSESVIKLDSNLNLLDWWAPTNWSTLDGSDTDLGSSMPLLLPGGLVFQIGKGGVGYLLSASSLGHDGANPVFQANVCNGSWGGGIYYNGVIYVACSDGMYALALDTAAKAFSPVPGWTVNGNAVGPPIEAGGLIWSVGYNNGTLYGLDPGSGATSFSTGLGGFVHFATPSAAGGLLFVGNGTRVTAFRIASTPGASTTSTTLISSRNPAAVGQAVTLTATVSPTPDGGTVAFADGGSAIAGCGTVAVSPASPQAACTTTFGSVGTHAIVASYSGDTYYTGSSASLSQSVTSSPGGGPGPTGKVVPVISHLKARAVKRKLWLSLTLSVPAKLTIVLSRPLAGRIVHRRCRAGVKRGRRCTILLRKAIFRINARQGRQTLRPRMKPLAPGRYVVTVTAISASGGRSRRYTVTVVVRRP